MERIVTDGTSGMTRRELVAAAAAMTALLRNITLPARFQLKPRWHAAWVPVWAVPLRGGQIRIGIYTPVWMVPFLMPPI